MKKILLSLFCLTAFINLDAQTLVNIGNGSSYTANYESSPINIYYRSHHCQIIYTPAEINAAGYAGSGLITKLGFNIYGTTTYGLPNFTIKLKNTSVNDLTVYDTTGITTVYTSPSYSPTAGGFDLLTLTNSFTWDGISNLLVDVCFDQVPAWAYAGQVYTFSYSSGGSQYESVWADNASQCGISTINANTTFKPQIQIEFPSLPLCVGTPTPGYAIASSNLVCPNTPFQLDYLGGDFASGLLYQWQSSPDGSTWSNVGTASTSKNRTIGSIADTTYFRCIITCTASAQSNTCTATVVNLNPLNNCYCIPSYALICTNDKIIDFSIANVVYQQSNCDLNGYSDSTSSAYTAINLNAGITYSLQANIANSTSGGNMAAGAWIDFNQNGVFETAEFTSLGFGGQQIYSNQIAVPINIASGTVRMRIKVDANYAGAYTVLDPCNNNNFSSYGQILDYRVNLIAAPACSGSPTVATAVSSQTAVCSNVPYTLNLTNNSISSGIVYQWQSSLDGMTWTDIGTSQSTIPFTVSSQSVTTYYRCISTCTNSAASSISTPVTVLQNLPTACYCTPPAGFCGSSAITNVAFETLNDNPVCNTAAYVNNVGTLSPVALTANQTYTISTSLISQGPTNYIGVWIDYNQDGIFSNLDEYTYLGDTTTGVITNTISVPFTALAGSTRMRIKMEATWNNFQGLNSCANIESNCQTLDYDIIMTTASLCSGAPTAGNCTSSDSSVCSYNTFTLNLTGSSIASGINYQWQYSLDNVTWTDLTSSQTNVPYAVTNQTATTYYRCITTCLSSSLSSTSSVVTINQNPLLDCHCIPPPSNCSTGNEIRNVSVSTLNNSSTCSTNGYTDYSSSVPTVSLTIAQPYSINVKVGSDYNNYASVWIDYNQNGDYDTNEYTDLSSTSGAGDSTIYGNITLPTSALTGITRMRVRNTTYTHFLNNQPCDAGSMPMKSTLGTSSNYGETEDYMVTILQQNCSTINFPPSVSAIGTNTICYAESDTLNLSFNFPPVSGITFQWKSSTGGSYVNVGSAINTSSLIVTPSVTTSYYCEIMCNSTVILNSDTATITIRPSTNISGTVTVFPNTATPVAGRVILYKYEPFYTQFDSVAGQNIGAAGDYNFTSFNSGVYIVKAIPNLVSLQIAYGDSAINWKTAKQIVHGCIVDDVQNIQVKALPSATATPGPGRLSGIITQTVGFGHRPVVGPSNSNTNLFKPMVPGEPIGGIVVKGGRNPGGQMYTQTITGSDTTSPAWGTYTLTGLPLGDYFILVDITGLDTNSTYHVKITPADTVFKNLDFTVDSIEINPIYATSVGVHEIILEENKIKVYPNPATNFLTVQYDLQTSSSVKIELFDILGKAVRELLPETKQIANKYKTTWALDDLRAGLYFLKMNINGIESTVKISVTN